MILNFGFYNPEVFANPSLRLVQSIGVSGGVLGRSLSCRRHFLRRDEGRVDRTRAAVRTLGERLRSAHRLPTSPAPQVKTSAPGIRHLEMLGSELSAVMQTIRRLLVLCKCACEPLRGFPPYLLQSFGALKNRSSGPMTLSDMRGISRQVQSLNVFGAPFYAMQRLVHCCYRSK